MNILLVAVFFTACLFFGYNLWKRFLFLRKAKPDNRFNNWGARMKSVLLFVFFQRRMFGSFWSGLMHAVIFWGFIVVIFGTILGVSEIVFGFSLTNMYLSDYCIKYLMILNVAEILIVTAVVIALFRRVIVRPKRLTLNLDGIICLLFILILMISDIGSRYVGVGHLIYYLQYIHILALCGFIAYLPLSKHFHLVTAIPNVFFRSLESSGKINVMDCEDESLFLSENQSAFLKNLFTWKYFLDLLTCVECGRCEQICPASVTQKALSPKKVIKDTRRRLVDQKKESNENIILPEEAWNCTTCGACQKACPLFIEHIPKIIDARRFYSMVQGDLPEELAMSIDNVISAEGDIKCGNPYGLDKNCREDWAKELRVKRIYENSDCDVLFWVGCGGSYDDRIQKVAKAFAGSLVDMNINYGILGKQELCCGEWIRRAGNEYLYQALVQKNIEILKKYGVREIVTFCPHCFNTLKNEYPQFGGNFLVSHHTQFMYERGLALYLSTNRAKNKKVVYHDSCYLGRHNGIYHYPRKILESRLEVNLRGIKQSGENSFCCGGGGGRAFMEEVGGRKINEERAKQLLKTNPEIIATSCPFCITMLENALKAMGREDVKVLDVVEI